MTDALLVEVTRGSDVECQHAGSIAVVNTRGELLYQCGDPHRLTFTRSTIKPFQAAPFLQSGGVTHFGLDKREIALLCASHSGEAMHIEAVQSMLDKAGCVEQQLQCGCHVPMSYPTLDRLPPAGATFTQLHNNCSGKHAGFLAHCIHQGWSSHDYLSLTHPLQQVVRNSVAYFGGLPAAQMKAGTDGCSAPNYAMPLSRLAYAYARLAQGEETREYGDALATLRAAMTEYPELVSGTGRNDLAFMQTAPGDLVTKVGADGVQVIGSRSAGLGIALKIADGNMRALYTAAAEVMQQLGLVVNAPTSPLAPWLRPQLCNVMGLPTGEVRPILRLIKTL